MSSSKKWSIAGKREKPKDSLKKYVEAAPLEKLSPVDIFEANAEKIDPVNTLMNKFIDSIHSMNPPDAMEAMTRLIANGLEILASMVAERSNTIKTIDDAQRRIIAIDGYVPTVQDHFTDIMCPIHEIEKHLTSMKEQKKESMETLEKFLATCGVGGVRQTHQNNKNDEKGELCVVPSGRSYASAVGAVESPLVTDRPSEKADKKMFTYDSNIVDIELPFATNKGDCHPFTLNYLSSGNRIVLHLCGTVFTVGSVVFVHKRPAGVKNTDAMRCTNVPCTRGDCTFYHDPEGGYNKKSDSRVFALGYAIQMLERVKDDNAVLTDPSIRSADFLRDLVQLAGALLIRAAQIKTMYRTY